jgi:hypothetical protein
MLLWMTLAFSGIGCYGPIDTIKLLSTLSEYQGQLDEIKQTHADVTLRGHVVGEDGRPLPIRWSLLAPPGEPDHGTVLAVGYRKQAKWGESDDYDNRFDLTGFGKDCRFEIKIPYVYEVTAVCLVDGYDPASVDIVVPRSSTGKPPPFIVEKTIVMRRKSSTTQP